VTTEIFRISGVICRICGCRAAAALAEARSRITLEVVARRTASARKTFATPEFIKKKREICNTPEARRQCSKNAMKTLLNPEKNAERIRKIKETWKDPKKREAVSRRQKAFFANPDWKAEFLQTLVNTHTPEGIERQKQRCW
jgi:hypothetical protein